MKRTTLLAAAAVAIAVTAAVFSSDRTEAHGQQVQLLWMSSMGRTVSGDLKYCTGSGTPVYHGTNNMFIDVMIGTSDPTLCTTPSGSGQTVRLRTWGFSSVYHGTIATISSIGTTPSGCHYIQLGMIDAESLYRGNPRFTHATGSVGTIRSIYAGPSPYGAVTELTIGSTYSEPAGCPWTGQHVHQGFADITCPDKNGSLGVSDRNFVWGLYDWVHQMNYREGHVGC